MKIDVYSPTIRRKEMDAVLTVMVENKIGPGGEAKLLIQTARERLKFDQCLALRSPAIALHLALKYLELKEGQGVVISALSPLYYSRVIEDLGLTVIYCDVQASTVCMSRASIEKSLVNLGEGVVAGCVVLHHTLGYLCDVADIAELGIPIIEDCSQSYGSVIGRSEADESGEDDNSNGKAPIALDLAVGVHSSFTILGLEECDMLTSGGGSLLFSAGRRSLKQREAAGARSAWLPSDFPAELGLPDLNAALAVVQFREANKNLVKRREIARLYSQSVLRTRHKRFIQNDVISANAQGFKPSNEDGEEKLPVLYNNYAFSLILETGVKDVKAYAKRKDISVESAFENTPIGNGTVLPKLCPEAYSLSLRTVLFPIYPRLGMANAGRVAKLIQTLP